MKNDLALLKKGLLDTSGPLSFEHLSGKQLIAEIEEFSKNRGWQFDVLPPFGRSTS